MAKTTKKKGVRKPAKKSLRYSKRKAETETLKLNASPDEIVDILFKK